jgi:hypothetical protein
VPANRAVVSIGRYAVTLPTCPNWSQSLRYEFTNALSSNYGCANATNLGLMVASPADLASGRPFTGIEAQPAASAVQRYLTDRVKQPPAPTPSPFAPSGATAAGARPEARRVQPARDAGAVRCRRRGCGGVKLVLRLRVSDQLISI